MRRQETCYILFPTVFDSTLDTLRMLNFLEDLVHLLYWFFLLVWKVLLDSYELEWWLSHEAYIYCAHDSIATYCHSVFFCTKKRSHFFYLTFFPKEKGAVGIPLLFYRKKAKSHQMTNGCDHCTPDSPYSPLTVFDTFFIQPLHSLCKTLSLSFERRERASFSLLHSFLVASVYVVLCERERSRIVYQLTFSVKF